MCIRDRWYTSGEAISNVLDELSISSALTESRVTSAVSAAADSASSGADAVPVSYTHLDVYKRQRESTAASGAYASTPPLLRHKTHEK